MRFINSVCRKFDTHCLFLSMAHRQKLGEVYINKKSFNLLKLFCGAYGTPGPYIKPFLNKAKERVTRSYWFSVSILVTKIYKVFTLKG